MSKNLLIKQLTNIENAKRINRERVAFLVLENTELITYLVEIMFASDSKISIKAAWILEIVCEKNLSFIGPHLDYFTENIGNLKHDSAVRPASKICNFIAIAYNSKKDILFKNFLTKTHIDKIIETGFDWMLSNHKVATKAYSMNALFLLGKNYDWVHQELKLILQQNITKESAAYKARGKMTLDLINKQ
ncbi:adenylosuccinate lyase [Lutibacter sp.]|uniref:adenylosuccinate lyase n=1 Tax=Lutibacter sp. TaxID=1925666 RepID=UPI0034A00CDB